MEQGREMATGQRSVFPGPTSSWEHLLWGPGHNLWHLQIGAFLAWKPGEATASQTTDGPMTWLSFKTTSHLVASCSFILSLWICWCTWLIKGNFAVCPCCCLKGAGWRPDKGFSQLLCLGCGMPSPERPAQPLSGLPFTEQQRCGFAHQPFGLRQMKSSTFPANFVFSDFSCALLLLFAKLAVCFSLSD